LLVVNAGHFCDRHPHLFGQCYPVQERDSQIAP
jgi:hypothetical protein